MRALMYHLLYDCGWGVWYRNIGQSRIIDPLAIAAAASRPALIVRGNIQRTE